jgi:5-formyltetrahydrofolate cyclo-ligase
LNSISDKKEIRKEIFRQLREQAPSLRRDRSRKVQEALLSSREFLESKLIMTYVSLPAEVDTRYFIEEALKRGKRIAAPCIDKESETIIASELSSIDDLAKGPYGIYEPKGGAARAIPLKEINLVVVPGIAFDKRNYRLGRGKGYYDKFLADEDLSSSSKIGLAFSFQIVDSLPLAPHDMPVSRVITD